MQPFDGEESQEQYLNRLIHASRVSVLHSDTWLRYVEEQEEHPEAMINLAQAAIDRARANAVASGDALGAYMMDQDPRPESARRQWLYKKGIKGTDARQ